MREDTAKASIFGATLISLGVGMFLDMTRLWEFHISNIDAIHTKEY